MGIFVKIYLLVLTLLSIFCIHRFYLFILYRKLKNTKIKPLKKFKKLPFVTVQLPVYNEMYVVKRLIDSACKLNYPKDRFEIQILDDSTDETTEIIAKLTEKYKSLGFNIYHIRRNSRKGFKAGALQYGLNLAKGEFIAIFDADFIIPENFLIETIHYFTDEKVGMVQTCWDFINRDYSILTKVQSLILTAHFKIEHFVRNRSGRFFNFNGTAGIWRKEAIISSGGWQDDTLTEDLDLSYRAQLNGWKFIFLENVKSSSELPVNMNAFKKQQYRWTKGSVQSFIKLFPEILKKDLPFKVKLEAFFHLGGNFSYLFVLILSIIMYPAIVERINQGWYQLLFSDFPIFLVSFISIFLFYSTVCENFLIIPVLMAVCIGMSINNSFAVISAIIGQKSEFERTPKFNIKSKKDKWFLKKYTERLFFLPFVEILMGLYYVFVIKFAIIRETFFSIPFILIFFTGFFYCGFLSFFHNLLVRAK